MPSMSVSRRLGMLVARTPGKDKSGPLARRTRPNHQTFGLKRKIKKRMAASLARFHATNIHKLSAQGVLHAIHQSEAGVPGLARPLRCLIGSKACESEEAEGQNDHTGAKDLHDNLGRGPCKLRRVLTDLRKAGRPLRTSWVSAELRGHWNRRRHSNTSSAWKPAVGVCEAPAKLRDALFSSGVAVAHEGHQTNLWVKAQNVQMDHASWEVLPVAI